MTRWRQSGPGPVISGMKQALVVPPCTDGRLQSTVDDFDTWSGWALRWERRTGGNPLGTGVVTVVAAAPIAVAMMAAAEAGPSFLLGPAVGAGVAAGIALVRLAPSIDYFWWSNGRQALFQPRLEDRVFLPLRGMFEAEEKALANNTDAADVRRTVMALDCLQETHRILALRLLLVRLTFADRDRLRGVWWLVAGLLALLLLLVGGTMAVVLARRGAEAGAAVPSLGLWLTPGMGTVIVALSLSCGTTFVVLRAHRTVRRDIVTKIDGVLMVVPPPLRDGFRDTMTDWAAIMARDLTDWQLGAMTRGVPQITPAAA